MVTDISATLRATVNSSSSELCNLTSAMFSARTQAGTGDKGDVEGRGAQSKVRLTSKCGKVRNSDAPNRTERGKWCVGRGLQPFCGKDFLPGKKPSLSENRG
jgi:hypothetical protein